MSKAKKKGKGKKEEEVIPKYSPDNLIESLKVDINSGEEEMNKIVDVLSTKVQDLHNKSISFSKEKASVKKILDIKTKENVHLNEEITKMRNKREEFERDCKKTFDKKFEEVQEQKKAEIEKITDEMNSVKVNLKVVNEEKDELLTKVEGLENEIEKLNQENLSIIKKYDSQIKELNEKHRNKLKQTTDIFEKFLQNNQELLKTDLYSDYKELKNKYQTKTHECIEFQQKNGELSLQNRMFRSSLDNNEKIINECALAQVEAKKRNKKLQEELEKKDKIIEQLTQECQNQINNINDKFSQLLQENETEINTLKNELDNKNKRLYEIQKSSNEVFKSRSDFEIYFIERLRECKIETVKRKMIEEEKKKNFFPFINMSMNYSSQMNNSSGSTRDEDSIYMSNAKKLDIKDIEQEYKDKLLRTILNKFNDGDFKFHKKGFKKIRDNSK